MNRPTAIRIIQITIAALVAIAILQELNKPKETRKWHGKVLGFIPYEFRVPTWYRLKDSFWDPYEKHILTPTVFGLGWSINISALMENLGLIPQPDISEESFLMPNKRMRQILRPE